MVSRACLREHQTPCLLLQPGDRQAECVEQRDAHENAQAATLPNGATGRATAVGGLDEHSACEEDAEYGVVAEVPVGPFALHCAHRHGVHRRDDRERGGGRRHHRRPQKDRGSGASAQLVQRACDGIRHHKEKTGAGRHAIGRHIRRRRREANDSMKGEGCRDAGARTARPPLRVEGVQRGHDRLDQKRGRRSDERDVLGDHRHDHRKEAIL